MADENRKIAYTKNVLKEALRELLMKKPIENITVTELCRCANINRTTFYKYYAIPADILVELRETLVQHLDQSNSAAQWNNIYDLSLGWCNAIYKDMKDWQMLAIWKPNQETFFLQADEHWLSYCKSKKGLTAEGAALLFRFMQYGTSGLTNDWIRKKDPEPPEVFADQVVAILKLLV